MQEFFFGFFLKMFSCYKTDMKCRNFFWSSFYVLLLQRGYEVQECILVFTLCFLKANDYKVQQKKNWVLFSMFFLAIVGLEGAFYFLFHCCKKLIIFLLCECRTCDNMVARKRHHLHQVGC